MQTCYLLILGVGVITCLDFRHGRAAGVPEPNPNHILG